MLVLWFLDAWLLPMEGGWFMAGWRSVPWFSLAGGGILCGIWFSWRSLGDAAIAVWRCLLKADLPAARREVSMIVGRDTASLDEAGLARATVETVAENSVDGGLAPVFFALLGGPVLLTLYKAASTLDSMVGYRNEAYQDLGMVSARLDDALNYIPARLALAVVPLAAVMAAQRPLESLRIGLRDHARHPSPNSGWGESLFAGALDVQLGGPATYGGVPSAKPLLGEPHRPMAAGRIPEAIRLLQAMAALSALAAAALAALAWTRLG
jgi:adenosylcobinamide-phosphate synthase